MLWSKGLCALKIHAFKPSLPVRLYWEVGILWKKVRPNKVTKCAGLNPGGLVFLQEEMQVGWLSFKSIYLSFPLCVT